MEANGMTFSDFAAMEKIGNRHRGVANTGLALGAVALGVSIFGTLAIGWGVNAVSAARSRAAENLFAANATRQNDILSLVASERLSRENWQAANQPSLTQYVDVQTNPSLSAQLMDYIRTEANAQATATAAANNNGINSAIGGDRYVRAMLYSAPQPCGCPCGQ